MKCDRADVDSTAKSELKVRCGPRAKISDRKQEMTPAAMQQLCQGERRRRERKEGVERSGEVGGYTSAPSTLLFSARVKPSSSESCSLLEFPTVMHQRQQKYSGLHRAAQLIKEQTDNNNSALYPTETFPIICWI